MRAATRFYSVQSNLRTNPVQDFVHAKSLQILLNGDEIASVDYEILNSNLYDLTHTSIPEKYQGQGLGTILAERIFDHLASNNKKFKLSCEFLQNINKQFGTKYEMFVLD
ncbi:hypothetical protein JTB14_024786 [Gonioctena quinquepunctata]|nr:hypothetical protein JTB14_024786 [Gonioctena quinquepunctata]